MSVNNTSSDFKKRLRFHRKRLNKINKAVSRLSATPVDYLIECLKLLRDYYIFTGSPVDGDTINNYYVSSLETAIRTYDSWLNCADEFYVLKDGMVTPKSGRSSEEAATKFAEALEKRFTLFWSIVSTHIGGWVLNAGIQIH